MLTNLYLGTLNLFNAIYGLYVFILLCFIISTYRAINFLPEYGFGLTRCSHYGDIVLLIIF